MPKPRRSYAHIIHLLYTSDAGVNVDVRLWIPKGAALFLAGSNTFKHESGIIQLTKVVTIENSTDLERGSCPEIDCR